MCNINVAKNFAPSGASKRFAQQNLVLGGIHFRRYKIKSERRRALARRSPKNRVRFERTLFFGTGGGNRTRTPSLAMDFESTSSTSSNTPAQCPPFRRLHWLLYRMNRKKAIEKRNFFGEKLARNWCRNSHPFMLKCKLYPCGIVSAVSQCPSVRHHPSGST